VEPHPARGCAFFLFFLRFLHIFYFTWLIWGICVFFERGVELMRVSALPSNWSMFFFLPQNAQREPHVLVPILLKRAVSYSDCGNAVPSVCATPRTPGAEIFTSPFSQIAAPSPG
jgi:hypothetical protein